MASPTKIKIRPMGLKDLDTIFLIDQKIRKVGKAITYANFTTEYIFAIERKERLQKRPTGYIDLITGGVDKLLELGFVAEIRGLVRGFILGRVTSVGEPATQVGSIIILGVHPNYWRRGIATQLVDAICEKYRAKGINTVRIGIDWRDQELQDFFKRIGFTAGRLRDYSKTIESIES